MAAIETQGTRVYWSSSTAVSTSTSALIGSVQDFSGPGGEAADIDITSFDSTAKEFLIGLRDEGNFTINVLRDITNTAQTNLIADRASRTQRKLVVDFSTNSVTSSAVGSRLTMDAYCKGFAVSGGADDAVKAAINFRITGAVDSTKQTS
jgi:hypothetical protein